MDLLRVVLLRLPPSQWEFGAEIVDEKSQMKYLTQRDVNPLNGSNFEPICYLGLLTMNADRYVPIRLLLARAAFLRDKEMYIHFAKQVLSKSRIDPDLALISAVPEIQAAMLALEGENGEIIMDPEIIEWTPGMIRYYSKLLIHSRFDVARWTGGYLQIPLVHLAGAISITSISTDI